MRSHHRGGPRRRGRVLAAAFAGVLVAGGVTTFATASEDQTDGQTTAQEVVEETIEVTEDFDGGGATFVPGDGLGGGDQDEDQLPVFEVSNGATLSNVVIGAPGADGVHCQGSCTLQNVVWEDVGEDAATFRGDASSQYTVSGGSAANADDKVFQFNGSGTLTIRDFEAEDFGTFVRSCGNCSSMSDRHIVLDGVTLRAPGNTVAGINENYGDTARFSNITIVGDDDMTVCQRYIGNDEGDEPEESGEGPDGTHCLYSESDISYQ
ncbi:pectate lyase [Streptomyces sp. 4N509B]|uniref:pectate lyase n=1 Tax=Streptomyces sp. 4N509B TaxID=3457413 RepID=UPI003FD67AB6